jgi:hypothetical protein
LTEPSPQALGAGVWIDRQQREGIAAAGVRVVDSGVGADKTVSRLGDQHSFRAEHPDALVEHDLHHPRIRFGDEAAGDSHSLLAGSHIVEIDEPAFGLRNDLLRNDQDISCFELGARGYQPAEVVAGPNLGQALDTD